jgi:hypothetical protein
MTRPREIRASLTCVGLTALLMVAAQGVEAGEITLFWSHNKPSGSDAMARGAWRDGVGATLALGLMKVAQVEVEGARGLDSTGVLRMTYFTAGAALKLPFTKVAPFAGVGVGVFHQSVGDSWMINTHAAAFVGVKARIADLLVLRAEYRRFELRGISETLQPVETFQPLKSRFTLGAGIAF